MYESPSLNLLLAHIERIEEKLTHLVQQQQELNDLVSQQSILKEWYSTSELADIMGVKQYTVQERWCNQGRIECEKEPDSGKWRIPGPEVERLKNGGALLNRNSTSLFT